MLSGAFGRVFKGILQREQVEGEQSKTVQVAIKTIKSKCQQTTTHHAIVFQFIPIVEPCTHALINKKQIHPPSSCTHMHLLPHTYIHTYTHTPWPTDTQGMYSELKAFIEESALMCSFNHPHVLGMVGICLDTVQSPYLLLPYMANGDLRTFLRNKRDTAKSSDTGYPEVLFYHNICLVSYQLHSFSLSFTMLKISTKILFKTGIGIQSVGETVLWDSNWNGVSGF